MERLCAKYICENVDKETPTCDFSFNALLTFPASGIVPKHHKKIALFLLDRKLSDKKLNSIYNKIKKHPLKLEKYNQVMPEVEKARKIAEKVGMENIFASCCLDRGYYCPVCHTFQMQIEFFMSWKDEHGNVQVFTFEHRCRKCSSQLLKLTGSLKQTEKLKCPKCGGNVKIDASSVINVVTRYS